jgi:hypothetical protein
VPVSVMMMSNNLSIDPVRVEGCGTETHRCLRTTFPCVAKTTRA